MAICGLLKQRRSRARATEQRLAGRRAAGGARVKPDVEAHTMNESAVHAVMTEARNCALVMLESTTYIQSELANVRMNDALRAQTEQVCTALAGTKHDIISELFELDELLGSEASASAIPADARGAPLNRSVSHRRVPNVARLWIHGLQTAFGAYARPKTRYKYPRVAVSSVRELPLLGSGKTDYVTLKQSVEQNKASDAASL